MDVTAFVGTTRVPISAVDNGDGTYSLKTTGGGGGGSTVTSTDKSGNIAAGGTAQTAIALNANRRAFWIQNLSSGDLWISDVGTATTASPSLKIVAGGLYESQPGHCPTSAISIIGSTTSQAFAAREYT